jgi:hypothetical protein
MATQAPSTRDHRSPGATTTLIYGGKQVTPLQTYIDQDNDCEILPWPLMMNAPPSMRKPHVLR